MMNEIDTTVVKNQLFRLLWRTFPYLRLKLGRFESNSIVTRELIPLFYAESANQHSLPSVQPPLLCGLQYSNLRQKILTGCHFLFFIFATFACLGIFQEMKRIICEYTFAI